MTRCNAFGYDFDVMADDMDGGYVAHCVDPPGLWTQGDDLDELACNMARVLALVTR